MKNKNKKVFLQVKQGSILAYSLIIIAAMVAIAGSLSTVAIIEKKGASGTQFSTQALQTADSGMQLALKKINREMVGTPPGNIRDAFQAACNAGKVVGTDAGPLGSQYEITLFDSVNAQIIDCNERVSNVKSIKSIGTYRGTLRAVSVSVAKNFTCAIGVVVAGRAPDTLNYCAITAEDGKTWLDRNLGATQVANAFDDTNAYGWYYQWGRGTDGHQDSAGPITTVLSSSDTPGSDRFISVADPPLDWRSPQENNLWQGVDGINNPCPVGYRLPKNADFITLIESAAADITNNNSAFNSSLKFTTAGDTDSNANRLRQGSEGRYWSSGIDTVYGYDTSSALLLTDTSSQVAKSDGRVFGRSVRCIKD